LADMVEARVLVFLFFLISAVVAATSTQLRVRYDGYSLIRVFNEPAKVLQDPSSPSIVFAPEIDVWGATPEHVDLLVPPAMLSSTISWLGQQQHEVVVQDIQALIDNEINPERAPWTSVGTRSEFFKDFRDHGEYLRYFDQLVAEHPGLLTMSVIGKTYEGREIVSIRLTTGGDSKPVIYIEAAIHPREWLAPPTALYSLTALVEGYSLGDPVANRLVSEIEWHFVILLNVDGYVYTWNTDRLWRKNRRLNSGSPFYGVDLNRNWGPNNTWCTSGSSTLPLSDTYCGTGPFSEPESLATSKAESALGDRMAGLLAFHTYGPLLLRPYQHTYNKPPEPYNTEVTHLGAKMEAAINGVHNAKYRSIQGSNLYPHSGGTIDWTYESFGVPAYTIELRGNNFIVPASEIILSAEESFVGVCVFSEHILNRYHLRGL